MTAEVSASGQFSAARPVGLSRQRLGIGFLNWAHALDHFVILIYPTVVIKLQLTYGRSYSDLIALSTASFIAFGLFSLPAGWLADRWSRRNMMVAFFLGCGMSLVAAAFAPSLTVLAVALFVLGIFAAIYHPVGTAMVIASATQRGRTLALNGVCGNIGDLACRRHHCAPDRSAVMARRLFRAGRRVHRDRRRLSLAHSR